MRPLKGAAAGLTAATAVAALLMVTHDATATTADTGRGAGDAPRTVTLLTGDRVTVLDGTGDAVSVRPGAGRSAITFATRRSRGHLSIIPSDAFGLLAAGRLDPRLFDVTTLLADGYDDRRADLPLIAMRTRGKQAVPSAGATVGRQLPKLGAVAMRQDRKKPGTFWQSLTTGRDRATTLAPGLEKVWLDGVRRPVLDVSVPQIGAPAAWRAGYTGAGVTVAVLDTGVDDTHPDLAGTVTARRNFTDGVEDDRDTVGHGTHVASTIAGSGAASAGKYRGVAPDARLLDGKVCVVDGCAESWLLAGMEWAAAEQRATVVNMSISGGDTPEIDPLEQAVDTLTEQYGTLFVVAAGNEYLPDSVGSPASADAALAVGAVDKSDKLADFSSRGPRVGDGAIKPDLTAPGVAITAARGKDSTEPGDSYATMSGTSMATPHVAGAAALLAQQHPDWTAGRLKATLMAAAKPSAGVDAFGQGAGRVDVAGAIAQTVTADPPSLGFGTQAWPHSDDKVLTRQVKYHNDGTAPVTLSLALDSAAPAGTFTVDPASVTVPAGGDATVTVSADTRVAGPDGRLTGALVATGDGTSTRTPVAVDKEIETHELTLDHIGRSGAPGEGFGVELISWDGTKIFSVLVDTGTTSLRVPAGRYLLAGTLLGFSTTFTTTFVTQPILDVTADRTVTMDERLAKASTVTVPRKSAAQLHAQVGLTLLTPGEPIESGQYGTTFEQVYTMQIGADAPSDALVSHLTGVWAEPGTDGTGAGSPYSYSVGYYRARGMISGYRHAVTESELAAVRLTTAGGNEGLHGYWFANSRLAGRPDENPYETLIMPLPVRQPSTVTRYFTTGGGVQWRSGLRQLTDDGYRGAYLFGAWTRYKPGRTYHEKWNQAVFGPAFPTPDDRDTGVTRLADTVTVDLPLFGDGAGRVGREKGTGSTTLYRDGVKVGESDAAGDGQFAVRPEDAALRLEVRSARDPVYQLSTAVSAAWSFRSGHVAGDRATLPLWTVRFTPPLDVSNTAPAGVDFAVPVTAVPAPGAQTGQLRDLAVEASFDEGRTWTGTEVRAGKALLRHPTGNGFVSLRATATDTAGNGVELTVIHAYRYGNAR